MLLCNVSLPLLCFHCIESATFTINCLLLLFNGGKCYNFKQAHIEPCTSLITNQSFLVATLQTRPNQLDQAIVQSSLSLSRFFSLFLSVLFKQQQQQLIMINEPRRYALYQLPRRQKENPTMMIIRRLRDTPLAYFLEIYPISSSFLKLIDDTKHLKEHVKSLFECFNSRCIICRGK